jgi:hypothetical protein
MGPREILISWGKRGKVDKKSLTYIQGHKSQLYGIIGLNSI